MGKLVGLAIDSFVIGLIFIIFREKWRQCDKPARFTEHNLFVKVYLFDASQVKPFSLFYKKIWKRLDVNIKRVFIFIFQKKIMLKLIFPDFSTFENHREGLNQSAIIVNDLDSDKGLKDIPELNHEPIFKFNNSHGKLLNIGRCIIFTKPAFHLPLLIVLNLPWNDLVDRLKAAIKLGLELYIVPCGKHEFMQIEKIANFRSQSQIGNITGYEVDWQILCQELSVSETVESLIDEFDLHDVTVVLLSKQRLRNVNNTANCTGQELTIRVFLATRPHHNLMNGIARVIHARQYYITVCYNEGQSKLMLKRYKKKNN